MIHSSSMRLVFTTSMAIRAVAVLIAVALLVLLPPWIALPAFFALGYAHFLLAFWYQRDAKKLSNQNIVLFLALLVLIVFASGFLSFPMYLFLIAVTFAFHMIRDELFLTKGTVSLFTTLEMLPFLVLYSGLLANSLFAVNLMVPAFVLAGVILGAYAMLSFWHGRMPDETSYIHFFWILVAALAYGYQSFFGDIGGGMWFLALTVMHYIVWYVEYWNKLSAKPERRMTYAWRVITANVLFAFLAGVWINGGTFLGVFFLPIFFYAWALLHILTSIRPQDYVRVFRLS